MILEVPSNPSCAVILWSQQTGAFRVRCCKSSSGLLECVPGKSCSAPCFGDPQHLWRGCAGVLAVGRERAVSYGTGLCFSAFLSPALFPLYLSLALSLPQHHREKTGECKESEEASELIIQAHQAQDLPQPQVPSSLYYLLVLRELPACREVPACTQHPHPGLAPGLNIFLHVMTQRFLNLMGSFFLACFLAPELDPL